MHSAPPPGGSSGRGVRAPTCTPGQQPGKRRSTSAPGTATSWRSTPRRATCAGVTMRPAESPVRRLSWPGSSTSQRSASLGTGTTRHVEDGPYRTFALDARTGKLVWQFPDGHYSPLVADDRRVYLVGRATVYGLVSHKASRQALPRLEVRKDRRAAPGPRCHARPPWQPASPGLGPSVVRRFMCPSGVPSRLSTSSAPARPGVSEAAKSLGIDVFGATERRRSRTYRAVGYTTAPVLKTSWATGPMPLPSSIVSAWDVPRQLRREAMLVLLQPRLRCPP